MVLNGKRHGHLIVNLYGLCNIILCKNQKQWYTRFVDDDRKLYRMTRKEAFISVLGIVIIILTAAIVGTLTEFGNFRIAQGQETLTAQQKAAMCDPSNSKLGFVNGTESEICGIPKTPTSLENTTISPELKAAMCDPSNPKLGFVNGTESEICGIPKTLPSSSANTTTGGEEEAPPPPSTSIAPSAVPPPEE